MSVSAKTQTLFESLLKLTHDQSDNGTSISFKTTVASSEVAQLAKGVLINENGGLIPAATALMKRKGCDFYTIKHDEEPGNAVVFVEVTGIRVCIYVKPGFVELVNDAAGNSVGKTDGFFSRLLKKFLG